MATEKLFDLFLSYNQESAQPTVKELYEKLKAKYGDSISIWVDYEQLARTASSNKLEGIIGGLKRSKCILCCVTNAYSTSTECQRELSYALGVHKGPRTILLLDRYDDLEGEGVKFQIINETVLNFHKNKVSLSLFTKIINIFF